MKTLQAFNPKSILEYYESNKDKVNEPVVSEKHTDYLGKSMFDYTGKKWNIGNRYGDNQYNRKDEVKSRLGDLGEARIRDLYAKFNLRDDSSQLKMFYTIPEPFILRGIQRKGKKKKEPQIWGTEALGRNPILGNIATRVDREISGIIRIAKSLVAPKGIVFIGTQLLLNMYVKLEYSFVSNKQPFMKRLIKVFKDGGSPQEIAKILTETRKAKNYAGVWAMDNVFGLDGYEKFKADEYLQADANLFSQAAKEAMIPIVFSQIDGVTDRLEFRGINLTGLTTSFNPNWSQKTYVGRPDAFHTYNSFGRGAISIGFDIYAISYLGLKGMYQKVNMLASLTAPIYDEQNRMVAPLSQMSVGSYFQGEDGYVSGVTIEPVMDMPWELGVSRADGSSYTLKEKLGLAGGLAKIKAAFQKKDSSDEIGEDAGDTEDMVRAYFPEGSMSLPRGFKVNVQFQPIENELPSQLGAHKIDGRSRPYVGPKDWVWQTES